MTNYIEKEKILTYPVVKWAGGKRQLFSEIKNNIPEFFNNYFEPFLGGGALFFDLQPEKAYLFDINQELINLYCVIKNNVQDLIDDLYKHKNTKEYFLEIRNVDRKIEYKKWNAVQKASRFIYLNRTCFNGLYRVNSKGEFNVPYGNYSNPRIIDKENLLNCSYILQRAEIRNADFSVILKYIKPKDFVYFDPPYMPLNNTSNFTSYTKEGFNINMQIKLRDLCNELNDRGIYFLLSNSDTKIINELYASYNIQKVFASRAINADVNKRGKISEVLIKIFNSLINF